MFHHIFFHFSKKKFYLVLGLFKSHLSHTVSFHFRDHVSRGFKSYSTKLQGHIISTSSLKKNPSDLHKCFLRKVILRSFSDIWKFDGYLKILANLNFSSCWQMAAREDKKIWLRNVVKVTNHSIHFKSYSEVIWIEQLFTFDEFYAVSSLKSNLLLRCKRKFFWPWFFLCHTLWFFLKTPPPILFTERKQTIAWNKRRPFV